MKLGLARGVALLTPARLRAAGGGIPADDRQEGGGRHRPCGKKEPSPEPWSRHLSAGVRPSPVPTLPTPWRSRSATAITRQRDARWAEAAGDAGLPRTRRQGCGHDRQTDRPPSTVERRRIGSSSTWAGLVINGLRLGPHPRRSLSRDASGLQSRPISRPTCARITSTSTASLDQAEERDWFRSAVLRSKGVGAKMALAILSVLSPEALIQAIAAQDKTRNWRVANGVGSQAGRADRRWSSRTRPAQLASGSGGRAPRGGRRQGCERADRSAGQSKKRSRRLVNLGYGRVRGPLAPWDTPRSAPGPRTPALEALGQGRPQGACGMTARARAPSPPNSADRRRFS